MAPYRSVAALVALSFLSTACGTNRIEGSDYGALAWSGRVRKNVTTFGGGEPGDSRHGIVIDYEATGIDGSLRLDTPSSTRAEYSTREYSLVPSYQGRFVEDRLVVTAGLGAGYADVEVDTRGALGTRATIHDLGPMLQAEVAWALAPRRLDVYARVGVWRDDWDEANTRFGVGLRSSLTENFAIETGYRYWEFEFDDHGRGVSTRSEVDIDAHAIMIGGVLTF